MRLNSRTLSVIAALAIVATPVMAEPPALQTPAPVIYLTDNLDEVDRLGWCIDTLGRGFAENLQAHSCKPQGGDVQFSFDGDSGLIRSVEFADYCMEFVPDAEPVFALGTCAPDNPRQQFVYDTATEAISPADDPALCVTVGAESRAAGPFMSRDLLMVSCAETDPVLRSWTFLGG
ncbi:MAG: ricin-type beta-trefoil lectin domain protein [Roseitalea sp.]|nr:ricin-type beta-trefoil lectin domain protein [Roseitalea sp.]MBO6723516.1 ricin-type beta-trefoil lectin domain protein [Roseitalea sp.]MBO6745312.1 ricin-type beta-trefoil lectin domain protein [Roseitalea sp.]